MKIIFHANTNQKVSVLELIADKIDTNARSITRNKQNPNWKYLGKWVCDRENSKSKHVE